MASHRSIEPLLEQLYSSVLDPDGLRIFSGSLNKYSGCDGGSPQLEQPRYAPSIWSGLLTQSVAVALNSDRRGAVSTDGDLAFAQLLQPHLRNAYAIQRRLDRLQAQLHTFHGLLDRLAAGIALLDARGRCLFANPQIRLLLGERDGLQLVRGRLRACIATDQLQLRALIALAVGGSTSPDSRLLLHSADGCPTLVLTLCSTLRGTAPGAGDSATHAIVFTQSVVPHPCKADAILRELFGFTAAETSLALALFDTGNLAEACEHLGKSLGTGRVQLRKLMEKTGCHRQSGLFRVLSVALSLPGAGAPLACPHNPFE